VSSSPFDFLKQFQGIQARMNELQARLKDVRVTGSAGAGMVTVELTGQLAVERVTIAPEAVDPSDVRMLEDLVRAALNDAHERLRERLRDEFSQITGIPGLPPGLFGI
jgi:DNA-binding YbaB/EbfC family protein